MRVGFLISAALVFSGCGEVVKTSPDAPVDADPCATATCECTPETEATDCGAHAVCDVSGPGRVCACAPAYSEQGGACVFAGAPLDPGMTDSAIWVPTGAGITVDAAAPGNVNAGEVKLTSEGVCALSGVTQRFRMPTRAQSEPFKLLVTHTVANDQQGFEIQGQLHVQVGAQWFEVPLSRNVYRTDTFCLGDGAYGGDLDFRVTSLANCTPFMGMATLNVDQVEVRVADPGECPDAGTVPNGDFEQMSNWTFLVSNGATGGFVAGVGEGGSRAAQFTTLTRCSDVTMSGQIAFPPASVPNQALEVHTSGGNARLQVRYENKGLATISASAQPRTHRICVPAWAKGTVGRLGIRLARSQITTCDAAMRTVNIDGLRFVSEPTCPDADLTDPGFERVANVSGPTTGWTLTNDVVNNLEAGQVNVVNNMGSAKTGSGYLSVSSSNECASAPYAAAAFRVPPAQGAAGPAVKFHGVLTPESDRSVAYAYLTLGTRQDAMAGTAYAPHTLCLPPKLIDRPIELRLGMRHADGSENCTVTIPFQSARFDDVEVTTDASCPAQ